MKLKKKINLPPWALLTPYGLLFCVFIIIPVAAAALFLALYNQTNLPPEVGILLQTDGSYAFTVARTVAVLCPVAVTALCLLLTLCSKKVTYPWLISLLSLTLPLLILMTNFFA